MPPRRHFLATAASTFAATSLSWNLTRDAHSAEGDAEGNQICAFTKPFQSLSYDELAEQAAVLEMDGIEATIRDGGHIEPADVPTELPKLVAALAKHGLEITVMASSINDADDPLTESVLRTAAGLGVKRYRMDYFRYEKGRPVAAQIADWRSKCRDLAALNAEVGIRAVYQNHAHAAMLGAALWDLAQVLEGIPVEQIGVAYDIRHATVEGGMSWPTTFQMIRPHVDTVYVKDFVWGDSAKPINVPLGQGRVDRQFFRLLARSDFQGPISLHEEYIDHRKPELVPKHWQAIKRDLATLRRWLAEA